MPFWVPFTEKARRWRTGPWEGVSTYRPKSLTVRHLLPKQWQHFSFHPRKCCGQTLLFVEFANGGFDAGRVAEGAQEVV